ncbi:MAG: response regulator transcription factor [Erysipelotrichaceae bacterium]
MKLLVVEDEPTLSKIIAKGLRALGYAIDCAMDGEAALFQLDQEHYDLVILDLNLPKISGWDVLTTLRKQENEIPVLILSANDQIQDKVQGLDLGASDYLTKPFDFLELEARIRVLLRRSRQGGSAQLVYDALLLDTSKKQLWVADEKIELTKKEYAILEYLLYHKEQVVSAEELIMHVWDQDVDLFSNSFKFHLSSLRKKIKLSLIQTIRGQGYVLCKEEAR